MKDKFDHSAWSYKAFNEELEKFYSDSVQYKHVSIDKNEMVKSIIKSLGDKKYVQKLLNEID